MPCFQRNSTYGRDDLINMKYSIKHGIRFGQGKVHFQGLHPHMRMVRNTAHLMLLCGRESIFTVGWSNLRSSQ